MKKNIEYVKLVIDRIQEETTIKREHLFYSIGVICILFMFINDYKSKTKTVKPITKEVVELVKTVKTMTFKEKFKASRAYHGPNGRFMWNGKQYHCKYVEEMNQSTNKEN